jgi:hypothetical protein
MFSKLNVIYAIIGLVGFVLLASLITKSSRDLKPPILTKDEAIHQATVYLAAQATVTDASQVNAIFHRGNWIVVFFVNPAARPGSILIRVNPITGNTQGIPLR